MAYNTLDMWLTEEGLFLIKCWARDGLTIEQICKRMNVPVPNIFRWRKQYPELAEALKEGKEYADYQVENALFKRCIGFKVTEVRTITNGRPNADGSRTVRKEKLEKEIIPDVTACLAWLNNRCSAKWKRNRDNVLTQEELDANKVTINVVKADKGQGSKISANIESDEEEWEAEWNSADDEEWSEE